MIVVTDTGPTKQGGEWEVVVKESVEFISQCVLDQIVVPFQYLQSRSQSHGLNMSDAVIDVSFQLLLIHRFREAALSDNSIGGAGSFLPTAFTEGGNHSIFFFGGCSLLDFPLLEMVSILVHSD
jgi:hypothetical protein